MDLWMKIVLIAVVLVAFGSALWQRHILRHTLHKMNDMLDAAIDGSFTEKTFDESMLSATENKLAGYLAASEVSSRNLVSEKEKIKELISDISHQTKTPIANILLYSQLLEEKKLSGDSGKCVDALNIESTKLSFLIDSLVKLSRLETGILTFNPAKTEIGPVLDEVRKQSYPLAVVKGIELHVDRTDGVAVLDSKWTSEALSNILENAIKYTPDGGKVNVRVKEYDMFCRIDVTDTGIGISEEEQTKVFRRFYRSPKVADQKGIGIGLYLTRKIIEGQGGYIKVTSDKNKGSTFSVFLPR